MGGVVVVPLLRKRHSTNLDHVTFFPLQLSPLFAYAVQRFCSFLTCLPRPLLILSAMFSSTLDLLEHYAATSGFHTSSATPSPHPVPQYDSWSLATIIVLVCLGLVSYCIVFGALSFFFASLLNRTPFEYRIHHPAYALLGLLPIFNLVGFGFLFYSVSRGLLRWAIASGKRPNRDAGRTKGMLACAVLLTYFFCAFVSLQAIALLILPSVGAVLFVSGILDLHVERAAIERLTVVGADDGVIASGEGELDLDKGLDDYPDDNLSD